jgi:hypothetical protein
MKEPDNVQLLLCGNSLGFHYFVWRNEVAIVLCLWLARVFYRQDLLDNLAAVRLTPEQQPAAFVGIGRLAVSGNCRQMFIS